MKQYILFFLMVIAQIGWSDFAYRRSIGGSIRDIAVYQDTNNGGKSYLYVAQGASIVIFDITDGNNPLELNRLYPVTTGIEKMVIGENVLVIAVKSQGVHLFSLEDPEHPQSAHVFDEIHGNDIQFVGHILMITDSNKQRGGPTSQFTYKTFHDIRDPFSPVHIKTFGFNSVINWKGPSEYYPSYQGNNKIEFYGMTQGIPPKEFFRYRMTQENDSEESTLSTIQIGPDDWSKISFNTMFAVRNIGFFLYADRLTSMDLSDPDNLRALDILPLKQLAREIVKEGTAAYINHENACTVVDISNPDALRIVDEFAYLFTPGTMANGMTFLIEQAGISVASIKESTQNNVFISLDVLQPERGLRKGNLLFSGYSEAIRIDRIHDDDKLSFISKIQLEGRFVDFIAQDTLLLAITSGGLYFYDTSDPYQPVFLSSLPLHVPYLHNLYRQLHGAVFLYGHYLYTVESDYTDQLYTLRIFTLEDRQNPREIKQIPLPYGFLENIEFGHYIYFIATQDGVTGQLGVLDLDDPDNPLNLGLFQETPIGLASDWQLSIEENVLIICESLPITSGPSDYNHLQTIDIQNPAQPLEINSSRMYYLEGARTNHFHIADARLQSDLLIVLGSDVILYLGSTGIQYLRLFDLTSTAVPIEIENIVFGANVNGPIVELNDHFLLSAGGAGYYMIGKPDNVSPVNDWSVYDR